MSEPSQSGSGLPIISAIEKALAEAITKARYAAGSRGITPPKFAYLGIQEARLFDALIRSSPFPALRDPHREAPRMFMNVEVLYVDKETHFHIA